MRTTRKRRSYFSPEDYTSQDGMLTTIWGPSTWHLLHCIAFNYPVNPTDEQKHQYMQFILSLQHVLPCGKCRKNLEQNFKKVPLTLASMASRDTFSRYIYRLHECVNQMLHKKSNLSFESVRDTYEHFRARCQDPTKTPRMREVGCVKPFYGKKTKCILRIVPATKKCKTWDRG
jgi:hypothetical protein